ncbi:unnamed protein product, partial [Allacma fusca]
WKMVNSTLGIWDFDGKKDGKEIRRVFLQEIRSRYRLQPERVIFVMTDNARKNVNAFVGDNVFLEDPVHDLAVDKSGSSDDEKNSSDCGSCGNYIPDEMGDIEFEDMGKNL